MTAIEELAELRQQVQSLLDERDKWQEIANRWLAVSNDQTLVCSSLREERDELLARCDYLQKIVDGEFPEGCTPADARVLREANHGLTAEIEALRQERDGLRARVAELVEVGTNCCDETPICQQEWNNAIAGASGVDTSIKVKAIHDSVAWLAKNYNHLAHPVCGLLTHYANQIEDAAMAKEKDDGN